MMVRISGLFMDGYGPDTKFRTWPDIRCLAEVFKFAGYPAWQPINVKYIILIKQGMAKKMLQTGSELGNISRLGFI